VRRLAGLLALLAAGGCGTPAAPSESYPHAYATPDCAPWDGAAVTFLFTPEPLAAGASSPPARHVRVSVFRPLASLPGLDVELDATENGQPVAQASACDAPGACDPIRSGTLHVESVEADGSVTGSVDLPLGRGERLAGAFDAEWRGRDPACG
jgi:hypothetical protein